MKQKILQTLKGFRWQQWLMVAAFLLVLGFTLVNVVHTVRRARYWQQHRDEPIRGWMTVNHVAHSYHVPPHVLSQALGLPAKPGKKPLREIAKEQNRSLDEIRAILQDAITHARSPSPPSSSNEGGKP